MNKKILIIFMALLMLTALLLVGCNSGGEESLVDYIEIYTSPKLLYVQGQSLDLSGAQIRVVYQRGEEEIIPVDESMISALNSALIGQQILQILYKGETTNIVVNVIPADISDIKLVIAATAKTEYIQDQLVDLKGFVIAIEYVGGVFDEIKVTESMLKNFDTSKIGVQDVTIAYTHNQTTYSFPLQMKVVAKQLTGIEIKKNPEKLTYYQNDIIDLTGGVITLRYDNNYPEDISMTSAGVTASWNNSSISDSSLVTLSYRNFTADFTVKVIKKNVDSYNIQRAPGNQLVNTPLDLSEMLFDVVYTNGQSEIFNMNQRNIIMDGEIPDSEKIYAVRVFGYDKSKVGTQTIELGIYSGAILLEYRIPVTVTVLDKEIEKIEIFRTRSFAGENPLNEETLYSMTEYRPSENWSYRLVYDNGEKSEMRDIYGAMLPENNNSAAYIFNTAGEHTWAISYQENHIYYYSEYKFTVLPLEITNAELYEFTGGQYVPKAFIKTFLLNPIVTADNYLKITYNSGNSKIVPLTTEMIDYDNFENDKQSTVSAPIIIREADAGIEYRGTIPVVIIRKVVGSLGIQREPNVTSYLLYNPTDDNGANAYKYHFNYEGLAVSLTYEGEAGSPSLITEFENDWTFSCSDWDGGEYGIFTSVGKKYIYLTYIGLENPENQGVVIEVNVTNEVLGIEYMESSLGYVYEGAKLDLTDKYITVIYENGMTESVPLTENMHSYNYMYPIEQGTTVLIITLTYTYGAGESRTVDVTLEIRQNIVVGIEIASYPDRLIYHKDAVYLDTTGLVVHLVYTNGTRAEVAESEYTVSSVDFGTIGEKVVVITYIGGQQEAYTDSFSIEVAEKTPETMAWTTGIPYLITSEGKSLDLNTAMIGGIPLISYTLDVMYSDGSDGMVTFGSLVNDIKILNYNMFAPGTQYVEMSYNGFCIIRLDVEVNRRQLVSVSAETKQFQVIEESDIDLSAARLILYFDNGTTNIVPIEQANIVISASNPNGYDKTDITKRNRETTISYTLNNVTHETTVFVNVVAKSLQNIYMKDLPKKDYIEGESFSVVGGSIVLYFNNGTTDIRYLENATIGVQGGLFNVNNFRFDNSEFSGYSKLQTIYVNLYYDGVFFETDYDVVMRDRKYLEISFSTSNRYSFTYGELPVDNLEAAKNMLPQFTVMGYSSFGAAGRDRIMDNGLFKIEYIPQEEYRNSSSTGKDYTVYPKDVGVYIMIISYNSALYGDMVHNDMVTSDTVSPIYVSIEKKVIYLGIEAVSKIYGTGNPSYYVYAIGSDGAGNKDIGASPFAYDDSFTGIGFADISKNHGTPCFVSGSATLINYIYIETRNTVNLDKISIGNNTNIGVYYIYADLIESNNYSIRYERSNFTVEKREVLITPDNISVEYGTVAIDITYAATAVWDGGGYKPDTGLCNGELLQGTLSRDDAANNSVNSYRITEGLLSFYNTNYEIIMDSEPKYVVIYKRDIYVRAVSAVKTYGEENPSEFEVEFYRDIACIDTNAFAFTQDKNAGLGHIITSCGAVKLSNIGNYPVTITVNSYTEDDGKLIIYGNYNIICLDTAFLQIVPRELTLEIENVSASYGEAEPELSYLIREPSGVNGKGLALNDIEQEVPLSGVLKKEAGDLIGSYRIHADDIAEKSKNYSITVIYGNFTIVEKEIFISIPESKLDKMYDGKLPSVKIEDAEIMHYDASGNFVPYVNAKLNLAAITISIENADRSVGDYNVLMQNSNLNYSVSFVMNAVGEITSYKYAITSMEIAYADLIFDVPDGKEYRETPYQLSATIKDEKIMFEYNIDGTVKTDADGNPVKDNVEITLSMLTASNAGSYSLRASSLTNANYKLIDADAAESVKSFTILRKILRVEVLNADAGGVYTSVYDAQPALLSDFVIRDSQGQIVSNINNVNVRVINPSGILTAPSVVRYDNLDENGALPKDADGNIIRTILAYDIMVEPLSDTNYQIELMKDYKFMIVPRHAELSINGELHKKYDGTLPNITAGMYYINSFTNIAQETLIFSFIRRGEGSDRYRANSDAGIYDISLTCNDLNHIVELASNYTFEIEKLDINVELLASSLTKSFESVKYVFTMADLRYFSVTGIAPRIKNYSDVTEYDAMKAAINLLVEIVIQYQDNLDLIVFEDLATAKVWTENSIADIKDLVQRLTGETNKKYLEYNDNGLRNENYSALIARVGAESTPDTLLGRLFVLNEYLKNATEWTAENQTQARTQLNSIKNVMTEVRRFMENETCYIAFVMENNNKDVTYAGTYIVKMYANDYNREYKFANAQFTNCIFTVTKKTIVIDVYGEQRIYGEDIGDIDYTVTDLAGKEITFVTINYRISYAGPLPVPVGTYDIITDFEMLPEYQNNYVVITGVLGKFIVDKAPLVIKIAENIGTGADEWTSVPGAAVPILYGDTIAQSRLVQWTYVSGLVDAVAPGGEIDYLRGILALETGATQFVVYNGAVKIDNLAATRLQAGLVYTIKFEGSYLAQNYEVEVEDGRLTVNKRPLSLVLTNDQTLEREYGCEFVFNFSGWASGENIADLGGSYTISVDTARSNASSYSLLTHATAPGVSYHAYFDITEGGVFQNYAIVLNDAGYDVSIRRTSLMCVITMRGGSITDRYITAVYGSNPDYELLFSGWKNGDEILYGEVADKPNITFYKNVDDDTPMSNLTIIFGQSFIDRLSDYIFNIEEVEYEVTPAPIDAVINKDLYVMYGDTFTDKNINPQAYRIRTNYNTDGEITSYAFYAGHYAPTDIAIIGLVNGETRADVFEFYTPIELSEGQTSVVDYLMPETLLRHTLIYTETLGSQTVKLSDFIFLRDVPNYSVNYLYSNMTVYAEVVDIIPDTDTVILDDMVVGDAWKNISVIARLQNSEDKTILLSEPGISLGGSFPSPNRNGTVNITYSKSYPMGAYTGPTNITPEGGATLPVNISGYQATRQNRPININLPVRVYNKTTTSENADLVKNGGSGSYVYGAEIDATDGAADMKDRTGKQYDLIDISLRLLQTKGTYSYSMYINGNSQQSLTLLFSRSGVELISFKNGEGSESWLLTNATGFDIFDGYIHNVKVYYDKYKGLLYITLDNNYLTLTTNVISVNGFYDNPVEESSLTGFVIDGAKAWIRHCVIGTQGYADIYGTVVKPAPENNVVRYLTAGVDSSLNINLASLFNGSAINSEYELRYYLNGALTTTNVSLNAGIYKVKLEVLKESVVISKYELEVIVSFAAGNSVTIARSGLSPQTPRGTSPAKLYGYDYLPADDMTAINGTAVTRTYDVTRQASTLFHSMSMNFTLENPDGLAGRAGTTTYLQLAATDTTYTNISTSTYPTNPEYRGIVLALSYGLGTSATTARLHVMLNSANYYIDIMPFRAINNWFLDGARYTVELYMDVPVDTANYTPYRFRIYVYRETELINMTTVDTTTLFTRRASGGQQEGQRLATTDLYNLFFSTYTSAVSLIDTKMTVYSFTYGETLVASRNMLYDGAYSICDGENGVAIGSTVAGEHSFVMANAYDQPYIGAFGKIILDFEITGENADSSIIWYFAASETNFAQGKRLALVYAKNAAGFMELSFTFYNGTQKYGSQRIVGGTDGFSLSGRHKIIVTLYRDRNTDNRYIAGVVDSLGASYTYSTLSVNLDGVEYTKNANDTAWDLRYPYTANMFNWLFNNGSRDTNNNSNNNSIAFLGLFNSTAMYINGVEMSVYRYDVRYKSV